MKSPNVNNLKWSNPGMEGSFTRIKKNGNCSPLITQLRSSGLYAASGPIKISGLLRRCCFFWEDFPEKTPQEKPYAFFEL
jgi:hypothetical protein